MKRIQGAVLVLLAIIMVLGFAAAQEKKDKGTAKSPTTEERLIAWKHELRAELTQQLHLDILRAKNEITQELRQQLKQELRQELKQELRQELKQELRMELRQELSIR